MEKYSLDVLADPNNVLVGLLTPALLEPKSDVPPPIEDPKAPVFWTAEPNAANEMVTVMVIILNQSQYY